MISDSIPKELILEIMLRLPAKSIARFHCVSKQWASMLSRPYFTELFLTSSSTQPRLLFAIKRNGLWCFFSLPKHQSPYDNSSSSLVVAADFHMKFLPNKIQMYSSSENRKLSCCYASGLTYFYDMYSEVRVICNPITGRYASLPYLKRYRKELSFFGFDPIDKQFKEWLKYAYSLRDDKFFTHDVFVVGVTATEMNTIQRVEIQGFGECQHEYDYYRSRVVYVFADHVEDLDVNDPKLLESSIYAPYVKTED
ncbi:unnamed protein product [Arabidopsis thaliana]|uniref:F-box domain-containing protein n=2 Tax=Arabidopsis TaxID=3701 RepID=A0A178WBR3_ARATH|nr:F-box domain [Arabidopsis thaliana x Arabidopsis arenosa]OAP15867.1 hypothetical protein AXX17_AT1G41270 [Arabidopsis thaliana]CAA0275939.1 unnamed protein product [Arabidopsis thaliana]VYS48357.1 unnamed protein product [Arabidopsis thaliana]